MTAEAAAQALVPAVPTLLKPSPAPAAQPVCLTIKTHNPADETERGRWDQYVKRSAQATFCHLSGWQRVIERTWQHRNHSLYAERGPEIVGVLPLFHVQSPLFGSMLISSPNAVYGGVVADDAEAYEALLARARQLGAELQVDFLELRNPPAAESDEPVFAEPGFELQDQLYVTFDHPITTDEEALLKTFPRDTRRMIRQGPKHNLTAELLRTEALDQFYNVYATSVRNLGTPVFPKRLFAEFLREFPEDCDILVIRQGEKVAGAVLSFYFRDTVMPYYAGAYAEFYRAGINNFMYAELMRQSAARGFTQFDFGRSKRGTGAYEFKRGWGMQERALPYQIHLVKAQQLPNLNPANPKFKLLIDLWKRLPLGLTKLLGPPLVKYLP
ncbi:MAG: FemAB family PEP-CTERM system-associated protein [Acidobacteria bacterium]|nr:FemAB family PEP-CTERM system-associated protein [Acidobacteriota bacterium]MBI3422421.1 FemAB family PEP-CTERM system-associated protein [Acidobacteriota bacterium]